MQIYTTYDFDRFMKKARVTDAMILQVAMELSNGQLREVVND